MSDNPHNFSPYPFSESHPPSLQGQQWQPPFPGQNGPSNPFGDLSQQNEQYAQYSQSAQPFDDTTPQHPPIPTFRPSPSLSGFSPLAEPRGLPQRPNERRVPLTRPDKTTPWPWRPTTRLAQLRSQLATPRTGYLHRNARLSQRQAQGLWGWFKQQDKNKQMAILCCLVALLLLCSSTLLLFAGNGDTPSGTTPDNAPTQAANQSNGRSTPTLSSTKATTPTATTMPTATPTTDVPLTVPSPTSQPVVQSTQPESAQTPTPQTTEPTPTPTTAAATPMPTPAATIPIIIPIETPPGMGPSTESAVPTPTGD